MEDVEDVRELVEQRMRAMGMEESIFDRILDVIERFDDEREKLIKSMLDPLEAPGSSDLRGRWRSSCSAALNELKELEEGIADALEDSKATALSASERMAKVGPRDFLSGERKIWQQIDKCDIPDAAVLIDKLVEVDTKMIKEYDEVLRKLRGDGKLIEALIQQNFGSITTSAKDLLAKYLITGPMRLAVRLMTDPVSASLSKSYFGAVEDRLEQNIEAAKRKRALKEIILERVEVLHEAEDQLSVAWIGALYAKGEGAAKGLRGVGRTGDYQAADWQRFSDVCVKALVKRRDVAKQKSEQLYKEILPTFEAESVRAFAALTDDPDTLEHFESEVKAMAASADTLVKKEIEFKDSLETGPYREAMAKTLDGLRRDLTDGFKMILSRTKDADDEVKK